MQRDWEIWLDNQLSSSLAKLMQIEFGLVVKSSYSLGQKIMEDREIYDLARKKGNVIVITKDADFPSLIAQYGCPPKVIKLNTGNLPTQLLWDTYKRILNQQ